MRKLLYVLTFIAAGQAGLCAFTPQASAELTCPKTDTSESHLIRLKNSCRSNCEDSYKKDPKTIPGCEKSCDDTHDFCAAKYKEWDKKKTECRKAIGACWAACPKENQKCMDKCNDKFLHQLADCAEHAMQ